MRIAVAILGVALVTTMAPVAAQEQGTLTPKLRVDFGLEQALKALPPGGRPVIRPQVQHSSPLMAPALTVFAVPTDCQMVKSHRHELLSTKTPVIAPSVQITHQLKVVTVPSCPAR